MSKTLDWGIDFDAIKVQLQNLPDQVYKEKMTKELGKAFNEQIRVNAPKRTGAYSKSWKVTQANEKLIRCETPQGKMYTMLEFKGSRPHLILPKRRKALRWFDSSNDLSPTAGISHDRPIFSKGVHHPGTKPEPHTRPAIKHIIPQIVKVLYRDLGQANTLFRQEAQQYASTKFNIKRTVTAKTGRKRLQRKRTARVKIDR